MRMRGQCLNVMVSSTVLDSLRPPSTAGRIVSYCDVLCSIVSYASFSPRPYCTITSSKDDPDGGVVRVAPAHGRPVRVHTGDWSLQLLEVRALLRRLAAVSVAQWR